MVVSTSTRDSRHFDRVLVPPARTFSFLHPCVNVSKGTVRWEFYRDLKRLVRGKRTNSNKSTSNYMTSIYGTFPSTTEVEAPRDFFSAFVLVLRLRGYVYIIHLCVSYSQTCAELKKSGFRSTRAIDRFISRNETRPGYIFQWLKRLI